MSAAAPLGGGPLPGAFPAGRPVVFLDVDGVLHPARPGRRKGARFRPEAMEALGAVLLTGGGAAVVLSSSWRLSEAGVSAVDAALVAAGLPPSAGRTPVSRCCGARPREILSWLDAHPPARAWVALDDIDLPRAARSGEERERLRGRCVTTDPRVGLRREDAEKALRILGRGPEARAEGGRGGTSRELKVELRAGEEGGRQTGAGATPPIG